MKRAVGVSAARMFALSLIALAGVALPSSAQTPPAIMFSAVDSLNNVSSVEIDSTGSATYGGACTATACPGTATVSAGEVGWSGTVGPFAISNALFKTKPFLAPAIDFGLGDVTTGATGGTLTVSFTDVDFNLATGPVGISILQQGGATTYTASFDPGNAPFAATTQIYNLKNNTTQLVTATASATVSGDPDSLTGSEVFTLGPNSNYQNDYQILATLRTISLTCSGATGTVGLPYSSTLVAGGGVAPYSFSITGGSLPNGLALTTTSGLISGTPTTAATFDFTAQVVDSSGISGANTVTASCAIVIAPQSGVTGGDTATIGFWHNKNGQALILALNGGSSSESLANWLASSFPYLYGAHSANDLTNKTNAAVAALFLTFFGEKGQKTDAQILAGALASYVTSSALAGTTAKSYGFNSSPGGTGAKTYNVGSDGSALGLINNGTYTVLELLMQANLTKANGTYNANALNDVFNGINSTGDIS